MNIVVTGAAGFLGRRLISALLRENSLTGRDGRSRPITAIKAIDQVDPGPFEDARVTPITGDIADPDEVARLIGETTDSVFHLAAVVSGQAEQDFDLGMRVNVDAARLMMDRIRRAAPGAKLVMTSSVAVFGGDLPARVPDTHVWEPQSSYGAQKAICDLLLSDYTRRGYLDGRSLRMPTVVVRPGAPNRAASSFASGIIREPINGLEAVCPVLPETVLWVTSPDQAIRNLLHGHELPSSRLERGRVINLPGLSVSVSEMLRSLREVAGDAAADRVILRPDPAVQRIVNSWPGAFTASYARSLGFTSDPDFRSVIEAFVSNLHAGAGA